MDPHRGTRGRDPGGAAGTRGDERPGGQVGRKEAESAAGHLQRPRLLPQALGVGPPGREGPGCRTHLLCPHSGMRGTPGNALGHTQVCAHYSVCHRGQAGRSPTTGGEAQVSAGRSAVQSALAASVSAASSPGAGRLPGTRGGQMLQATRASGQGAQTPWAVPCLLAFFSWSEDMGMTCARLCWGKHRCLGIAQASWASWRQMTRAVPPAGPRHRHS